MSAANIRVFLLTCRRPQLLRRALSSLLSQTYHDWVCELHNDAPDDDEPRQILAELAGNDTRFEYFPHPKNWGPVACFNHVFAGGPEPLASLLEDDNWWDPTFLANAVEAISARPDASLAWANMRIWEETPDGRWRDTGRTIWPNSARQPPQAFEGPEIIQAFDALHSNGAMVFRPDKFIPRAVPPETPFAIIEQLRERSATGPLVLLPTPLANFAVTRRTTRTSDATSWAQAKLLVAASFLDRVPVNTETLSRIWRTRQSLRPADTDIFFQLTLTSGNHRWIRFARLRHYLRFAAGALRHPLQALRALRFRTDHPEVWAWLVEQTRRWQLPAKATMLSKKDFPACSES